MAPPGIPGFNPGDAAADGAPKKKFFPKKFAGVGSYLEFFYLTVVSGEQFYPKPPSLSSVAEKKSVKPLPNAVKKKRFNFRLRKMIAPKAPVTVLNEMVGAVQFTFVDNPPLPPHMMMGPMGGPPCQLFTAQCSVDGEYFTGTGPTKSIAKNICAEHAIQYVVGQRSTSQASKPQGVDDQGKPLLPHQVCLASSAVSQIILNFIG